jgi:hypothetical protein
VQQLQFNDAFENGQKRGRQEEEGKLIFFALDMPSAV